MPGRTAFSLVVVAVLIGLFLAGYLWSIADKDKTVAPTRPAHVNLVLITLDTTRADHLGCYGHPDIETPHIDALADAGTLFENCTTPAPITLPSHSSLMTGFYPFVHGVRDNGQFQLDEGNETLAEVLVEAGYATVAHTAAYVLNREYGLAQGFETYVDARRQKERTADQVSDGAIEWLGDHSNDPIFLWVHFFDPHVPYTAPAKFRERYDDPYVAEIAFVDEQVGRLLDELDKLGLRENTLVALTADHGEGRNEHDEETHLYFLYESTLHVPLILRCPGRVPEDRRIEGEVRLTDVMPTVLDLLNLTDERVFQGISLLPAITGDEELPKLPAYGETFGGAFALGLSPMRSLRVDGWKYIHAPRPELYDLGNDPKELNNLAEQAPARVEELRDSLRAMLEEAPMYLDAVRSSASASHTGGDMARLMSMGYVGAGPNPEQKRKLEGGEMALFEPAGPDPKDHTADIRLMTQATHALVHDHYAEAEIILRQLADAFPESQGVSARLARSQFLQGKDAEAIALYQTIIDRHPGFAEAYYGIAKLKSRAGVLDDAVTYLRKTIDADPDYVVAHYDLGVIMGKLGERDAAADHYRAAIRLQPTHVNAKFNLAAALSSKGELAEAESLYREVLGIEPSNAVNHYMLANTLVRRNKLDEAAASYERALELRPDLEPARVALRRIRQQSADR